MADHNNSEFVTLGADQKEKFWLHELAAKNDIQHLTSKIVSLRQTLRADQVAAVLNEKNNKDETPLHVAAENNVGSSHYEVAEILLNNGADVHAKDRYSSQPLRYLVKDSVNLDMLKLFFRFKADFSWLHLYNSSLFIPTCDENLIGDSKLDILKFIVHEVGLDINHRAVHGRYPLHFFATFNQNDSNYRMLEFLLENGADVNARDPNGLTPLFELVKYGNLRVVELFFKYHADVHFFGKEGESILFSGIENIQVLEKLLQQYPDLNVNHQNVNNVTPLHISMDRFTVSSMDIQIIKCFLKNGANVNAADKDGVTPLIKAARNIWMYYEEFMENIDCFNLLIDQTDFSLANKNSSIFDYYFDRSQEDEVYLAQVLGDLTHLKYLDQWILEHLAKLNSLNIEINPILLEIINDKKDLNDYFSKCTQELEVVSNAKPQNCWITYLNLLVDSRRKLKNYSGNKDLIEDYEKNDWLKTFPIYGASIKKSVKKGLKRRELFDKSSILLSECIPIFNCTHLILRDILDCVMSKKDLSEFCKCGFIPY